MKILVVSDTHRNFAVLDDIVNENLDADLIIHLGDGENEARDIHNLHPEKPMIYVAGNCDYGMHRSKEIVTVSGSEMCIRDRSSAATVIIRMCMQVLRSWSKKPSRTTAKSRFTDTRTSTAPR